MAATFFVPSLLAFVRISIYNIVMIFKEKTDE